MRNRFLVRRAASDPDQARSSFTLAVRRLLIRTAGVERGSFRMRDRITANLPARNLDETTTFYAALGFQVGYKGEDWMIMRRGDLELEFFPHPGLDPSSSWHSACVRVADLDGLRRAWSEAGLPAHGVPRLAQPEDQPSGLRMFALVDPDGSLLRCFRLDD